MRLQLFIALRYLFSKKSHNIINIISMICAGGVCVATIALICTLSVYNGFQNIISGVISSFDPDLKVTLAEGKIFDLSEPQQKLQTIEPIELICPVLEETALIRGKEKQTFVTVKGVPHNYNEAVNADSVIEAGKFKLEDENGIYTVLGAALFNQIDASVGYDNPVSFYAPKYATKVNIANPNQSFNTQYAYISGIYATHQFEIDSKYAFLPLQYAQEIFNYNGLVSALEIKIKGDDIESAKTAIQNALGEKYVVQDKMEQHQDFYKMMKIEKWITFLILFFILMIAVVNIIGSLTMLILEKKNDIQTLKHLGATSSFIQQVFLLEGWLISALGTIAGLVIGLILCLIQEYFGIIKLGNGSDDGTFFIQAYPVYVQWTDILIILSTTLIAGLFIAWIPTRYIKKKEK